jgi:acetoin utilization deacetylase AcuC-like enzyme
MTRAALRGVDTIGFCAERPSGHHAEPERAMGFCLFDNVAVAAVMAIADLGLDRVLVLDWDVHHGKGTAHRRDPLANCNLETESFAQMAYQVRDLAARLGVPLGAVLEGGYDKASLVVSLVATMRALGGEGGAISAAPEAILRAIRFQVRCSVLH